MARKGACELSEMHTYDCDENGNHRHTVMLFDLITRIRSAKTAFNIPAGDSRRSDDRDYLEEVGRMALEVVSPIVEL